MLGSPAANGLYLFQYPFMGSLLYDLIYVIPLLEDPFNPAASTTSETTRLLCPQHLNMPSLSYFLSLLQNKIHLLALNVPRLAASMSCSLSLSGPQTLYANREEMYRKFYLNYAELIFFSEKKNIGLLNFSLGKYNLFVYVYFSLTYHILAFFFFHFEKIFF